MKIRANSRLAGAVLVLSLFVLSGVVFLPTVSWGGAGPQKETLADAPSGASPLYYQDRSGRPFYSATPKLGEDGQAYVPIYEDEATAPPQKQATNRPPLQAVPAKGEREILYYRNPMGLPDTSPVPKKDSMGMDYIAVYADEAGDDSGAVRVSPIKIQTLGVRTETVAMRPIAKTTRAVGRVVVDEAKVVTIDPRFDGWITKLFANTTGASVKRGEPLFAVYSPEVALTEAEYLIGLSADGAASTRSSNMKNVSLQKLKYMAVPDEEISRLRRTGIARQEIIYRSPASGIVLEKNALEGMKFGAGSSLFQIADLSSMWILVDVFEHDIAAIHIGDLAKATIDAYPGRVISGKVSFIYPTMESATRTTKIRIEVPNDDLLLKDEMYATVDVTSSQADRNALVLPVSAILDNGKEQVVLVDRGEGRFEPRNVKIGMRSGAYAEVIKGVDEGEAVVVSANFLIDSESNLRAALKNFSAPNQKDSQP
jgi:Cu(I)/Ag(I) efflux system membrane fusion protein